MNVAPHQFRASLQGVRALRKSAGGVDSVNLAIETDDQGMPAYTVSVRVPVHRVMGSGLKVSFAEFALNDDPAELGHVRSQILAEWKEGITEIIRYFRGTIGSAASLLPTQPRLPPPTEPQALAANTHNIAQFCAEASIAVQNLLHAYLTKVLDLYEEAVKSDSEDLDLKMLLQTQLIVSSVCKSNIIFMQALLHKHSIQPPVAAPLPAVSPGLPMMPGLFGRYTQA